MASTSRKKTYAIINRNGLKITHRGISSALVIVILAGIILGALTGGFLVKFLTRNDCFVMLPLDGQINLEIGGDTGVTAYHEPGVKCVSFGRDVTDTVSIKYYYREDLSHDAVIVTGIDTNVPGCYYVVYTSSTLQYKTVQHVRNVIVMAGEE